MTPDGWCHRFFDATFAAAVLERVPSEAELDGLAQLLDLRPGARVYDQCCGTGAVAVPLAARGYRVQGADLISEYVEGARARAEGAGVEAAFTVADARRHVPAPACDAAFNWYTSFGYSEDDAENLEMLRRAHEGLRPGGVLALEHRNLPGLLRVFQPRLERDHVVDGAALRSVRDSRLDLARGMLVQDWTWQRPGGPRRTLHTEVRLYMPHELRAMFEAAGFVDVRLHGGVDGAPLDLESPRLICVGRRPA